MKNYEPAFPVQEAYSMSTDRGMTLRDYFAAKVMQAAISKNGFYDDEKVFANWCYETADAMLSARSTKKARELK
jgi:hypothetical protein